jgi:hypothetical protein
MARQTARRSDSQEISHAERRPSARESIQAFKRTSPADLLWDLITFDRLLTGPVIHLIYWAGLLLLVLGGFATLGGAVGIALKEPGIMAVMLALPLLVFGLITLAAGALIWRSFCEFYVAIFRISDDLKAMRAAMEAGAAPRRAPEEGSDGGI